MLQKASDGLDDVLNGFVERMTKAEDEMSKTEKTKNIYKELAEIRKKQSFQSFQETCGIDKAFYGATIESPIFTEEMKKQLLGYIDSIKNGNGQFMILLGKVGTGKTYTAISIMNALGYGTYLDMPEMELKLNTADRFGSQETREALMHKWATCKLLVLDEIGRFAHKKEKEQEILFYLINKRYQNNRPTILCSNLEGAEFSQYVGEAVIDRIRSRRVRIDLNGESKRG